jgi:hypothetical protein
MEEQNEVEGTSTEIRDPQAVLSALEKAKAEAKKTRLEKEELEKQLAELTNKTSLAQARLMDEKILKNLSSLGIPNGAKLMKYIKLDQLQLTDDFEVAGLEDQIDALKTDFPELFDPKIIVGGKADSAMSKSIENILSVSDLQAKSVLFR